MNRAITLVLIVAIAATGGFFVQRALNGRNSVTPATEPATVRTDAPGQVGQQAPVPTVPETLPDVTLPDRNGTPRSLTSWKGQPLIINFWATWCGPCREEIPLLNTLRKERAADKLEVIGIAVDEQQAVVKFAKEFGIQYPVLMGEQEGYEAAERFGVASLVLPFSVFADSQGRIVTLKVGELHPDQAAAILDRVRDVDANRLSLADARRQIADKLRDLAADPSRDHDESGDGGHEHSGAGS
ncbi:MAG: TlpA disulfide reductase family protein [Gammaproteobacteria bacterium]